ncbi:AhpC/TSA family protein [Chitinophaga sp. Mgbs1]|uniref:AhpC/TSA family protein n=1 Tax=Chitinophaga solisilvae TaxID=1233460 RepID=A0A3S1D1N3_9BACT|nr:AhpC/TSA family protein [Chitinophaga solisilvae]
MKKILKMSIPLALLAAPAVLSAQQSGIVKSMTVKGSVEFTDPRQEVNKVFLLKENLSGKPKPVDSCVVGKDGSFSFKIKQDHQGIYTLDAFHWDRATFWSDGDVQVKMRGYDTARVKMKIPHYNYVNGSYDNNYINLAVLNSNMGYLRMVDEVNMEYFAKKATDTTWFAYMRDHKKYNPSREDNRLRDSVLLLAYQDRPVIIYSIRRMAGTESGKEYDAAMALLEKLMVKYPWLTEAKELKQTIIDNRAQAMKLKAGQPMPAVQYPDAEGKLQGLEQFKGKYLLVDFWASWCGPCRQAIPKVKELHSEYKEKGFDVVSISIDTDKAAWHKAMKDENMPWLQLLSDNKEKTMSAFQFSGIPTLYLIDREGRIMERFTGYSEEAEAKVKKALAGGTSAPAVKATGSVPMSGF